MSTNPRDELPYVVPKGYLLEHLYDRLTIRCQQCGMRWWADRMTHWANEVFLTEHRDKHASVRRRPPKPLPAGTPKSPPEPPGE